MSEDTSLSSLSKMNREEEEREVRGGDRTSQKAEAQLQFPCEVILRTGSKSARVLVGKMATEVRGLVCGQLQTLIEPRLSFHRVSIAGRELENCRPVCQIRPATCFVKNILLESSHAYLCMCRLWVLSQHEAKTGRKAGNIYCSPLDRRCFPPLLWGVDLAVSWKLGRGRVEVPACERQHTPKYKVTPHAPHPPRVAPSLLDSRGGKESET